MVQLLLVTAAPGRSGADALTRALICHPEVEAPEGWTAALLGAAHALTVHADSTSAWYLPRRAAQALTDLVSRLEECGDRGHVAADRLLRASRSRGVTIPVYGELYLPQEQQGAWWRATVRSTILDLAPAEARVVVLKSGAVNPPAVATILDPADRHVHIVRQPSPLVAGLAESVVDGLHPSEARHWVETARESTGVAYAELAITPMVVRLEHLCADPLAVLPSVLSDWCVDDLLADEQWIATAASTLPKDVVPPSDGDLIAAGGSADSSPATADGLRGG